MEVERQPDDVGVEPAPQPLGPPLADAAERSDVVRPDDDLVLRHLGTVAGYWVAARARARARVRARSPTRVGTSPTSLAVDATEESVTCLQRDRDK